MVADTAYASGTTVSITNLFEDLPVRHREFKRNIRKEYAKCLELVQAYALISTGVRITCTNQVGKRYAGSLPFPSRPRHTSHHVSPRNTVLATQGQANIKDNISDIFGSKILNQLAEVKIDLDADSERSVSVETCKPMSRSLM